MDIYINDTNILIDLGSLDLLDEFVKLDATFLTTDFVIAELKKEQQKKSVLRLIETNFIKTHSFSAIELMTIVSLKNENTGLSIEDCSVWYLAKEKNGILLSGDGKLRKQAQKDGIEVRGILYIFDEMVKSTIISKSTAVQKLHHLIALNVRLPLGEIQSRLKKWSV